MDILFYTKLIICQVYLRNICDFLVICYIYYELIIPSVKRTGTGINIDLLYFYLTSECLRGEELVRVGRWRMTQLQSV